MWCLERGLRCEEITGLSRHFTALCHCSVLPRTIRHWRVFEMAVVLRTTWSDLMAWLLNSARYQIFICFEYRVENEIITSVTTRPCPMQNWASLTAHSSMFWAWLFILDTAVHSLATSCRGLPEPDPQLILQSCNSSSCVVRCQQVYQCFVSDSVVCLAN